jgi:hypothetical protein
MTSLSSPLQHDADQIQAIGHGLLALFNAAIVLAIVAVILSTNSQMPQILRSFFQFVTWLVAQVIRPVTGGSNVALSPNLLPAFGAGQTSTGTNPSTVTGTGTGTSTGTGTGSALLTCVDTTSFAVLGQFSVCPAGSVAAGSLGTINVPTMPN